MIFSIIWSIIYLWFVMMQYCQAKGPLSTPRQLYLFSIYKDRLSGLRWTVSCVRMRVCFSLTTWAPTSQISVGWRTWRKQVGILIINVPIKFNFNPTQLIQKTRNAAMGPKLSASTSYWTESALVQSIMRGGAANMCFLKSKTSRGWCLKTGERAVVNGYICSYVLITTYFWLAICESKMYELRCPSDS